MKIFFLGCLLMLGIAAGLGMYGAFLGDSAPGVILFGAVLAMIVGFIGHVMRSDL